jgi:hypothetical protein
LTAFWDIIGPGAELTCMVEAEEYFLSFHSRTRNCSAIVEIPNKLPLKCRKLLYCAE